MIYAIKNGIMEAYKKYPDIDTEILEQKCLKYKNLFPYYY